MEDFHGFCIFTGFILVYTSHSCGVDQVSGLVQEGLEMSEAWDKFLSGQVIC